MGILGYNQFPYIPGTQELQRTPHTEFNQNFRCRSRPPRVVVHVFGLGEEPSWGAVKVQHVKQCTLEAVGSDDFLGFRELDNRNGSRSIIYFALEESKLLSRIRPRMQGYCIDNYENQKDPSSTRDNATLTTSTVPPILMKDARKE